MRRDLINLNRGRFYKVKVKRYLALLCLVCLVLPLAGCGEQDAVYVQSVEVLANLGGIAPGDRFAGLVVSENVTEITKDSDKSVKELFVREGDDVAEGQALFSYDTDELQLNLDKQNLELEQMYATIQNYQTQIATLERERSSVGESARLQYTIEIQSTQLNLKETQLNAKAKEAEVEKAKNLLANATVTSPIAGRVQSISEGSTDYYGESTAYITIQQHGSYRIKGVLGELQRGGIMEGDRLKVLSRTDDSVSWMGTVTLVDYENPTQGGDYDRYYGMSSDEMTAASKYPFYVELDDTTGLLLGQHVYMEVDTGEGPSGGLSISSAFICYEEDGSAYVWAEKRGKLEKRPVELGDFNEMMGTQEILSGLSVVDYIAFPDGELCQEGAPTTRDQVIEESLDGEADIMEMEGAVG